MLVSLTILSILAGVTIPYAQVAYLRSKEIKLQRALRQIRTALDKFNADCVSGNIASGQEGVSVNCYPTSLVILVDGVEAGDTDGTRRYYLRRIPRDPFADRDDEAVDHWDIRGYADETDGRWSGDDVFDIRVKNEKIALNKSEYKTW